MKSQEGLLHYRKDVGRGNGVGWGICFEGSYPISKCDQTVMCLISNGLVT